MQTVIYNICDLPSFQYRLFKTYIHIYIKIDTNGNVSFKNIILFQFDLLVIILKKTLFKFKLSHIPVFI